MNTKQYFRLRNNNRIELPTYADLSFGYICPKCKSQIWVHAKQLKTLKTIPCMVCDKVIKVVSISDIKIDYSTGVMTVPPISGNQKSNTVKQAMHLLLALGYSRKDSIRFIKAVPNFRSFKDPKQLIKKALSLVI